MQIHNLICAIAVRAWCEGSIPMLSFSQKSAFVAYTSSGIRAHSGNSFVRIFASECTGWYGYLLSPLLHKDTFHLTSIKICLFLKNNNNKTTTTTKKQQQNKQQQQQQNTHKKQTNKQTANLLKKQIHVDF